MKILGLSGYARSGKDTVADILVKEGGYKRIAFADKLRDFLYALNPMVGVEGEPFEGGLSEVGVQMVIDRYGWDGYKETEFGPVIRSYLQRLGTEAGRETLWEDIWVDVAFDNLNPLGNYVVTDMRFPNEMQGVRQRGGKTVRIERAGVGPATSPDGTVHASETSLDNARFDYRLHNSGTLEEFQEQVRKVFL